MSDYISRQAAIAVADSSDYVGLSIEDCKKVTDVVVKGLKQLPPVHQTLYGYKIEHLAYIAKVMEKEGVTAEYAAKTFEDISRAVRMIIEEAQQKAEEMLNEQFNQQIGSH